MPSLALRRSQDADSLCIETAVSPLPHDVEALKALLISTRQRADEAEAKLANATARESAIEAMIAHLKLQIAKLRREQYGASAELSPRAQQRASPVCFERFHMDRTKPACAHDLR